MLAEQSYLEQGISPELWQQSCVVLAGLKDQFAYWDELKEIKQMRVIQCLQNAGLRESALTGTTGYGYDDSGRRMVEDTFSRYFASEKALVRQQFSSGTQVLACCLRGLLRPGDEVIFASSELYDTIKATVGLDETCRHRDLGSLTDFGIKSHLVDLTPQGELDFPAVRSLINDHTKMVYLQKSLGYSTRNCLLNSQIKAFAEQLKAYAPDLILMVDNCYGEMVEATEPTQVGADLCAGSLIKNLGAGIADSGGYVCGRADLVEKVACAMTAPGLGGEIGPSLGHTRNIVRGFYLAPLIVTEAIKSALHAAGLMQALGYEVSPLPTASRGDIVQRISLHNRENLIRFCQAIQSASPVDASFAPVPAPMPGYDCDIIMASGSFVQGSSIELSCDGPLRPPFDAYLQGGLSFTNGRLAVLKAAQALWDGKNR